MCRDLNSKNLGGHLIPELGNLQHLQYLYANSQYLNYFPIYSPQKVSLLQKTCNFLNTYVHNLINFFERNFRTIDIFNLVRRYFKVFTEVIYYLLKNYTSICNKLTFWDEGVTFMNSFFFIFFFIIMNFLFNLIQFDFPI